MTNENNLISQERQETILSYFESLMLEEAKKKRDDIINSSENLKYSNEFFETEKYKELEKEFKVLKDVHKGTHAFINNMQNEIKEELNTSINFNPPFKNFLFNASNISLEMLMNLQSTNISLENTMEKNEEILEETFDKYIEQIKKEYIQDQLNMKNISPWSYSIAFDRARAKLETMSIAPLEDIIDTLREHVDFDEIIYKSDE